MRRARPVVVPNSPPASRMLVAQLVVELGGEGPRAHAGGVGLGDAPHLVDARGPTPAPTQAAPGDRVRGGDEGIGAVVDVEHRALGALEDDAGRPRRARATRSAACRRCTARAGGRGAGTPRSSCAGRARGSLANGPQHQPLGLHRRVDLLPQDLLVEQVLHRGCRAGRPCRRSRGRCRAGWCRSGACPSLRLARLVEELVVRHDQVRVGGDAQAARGRCRRRRSSSISSVSTRGSTTTPLPIAQSLPG